MKKILTLTILPFSLIACSTPEKVSQFIEQADNRAINFCEYLKSISGHTVASVKQRFGEASQEKSETLVSPHDDSYINQRVILQYQDGYIAIFEVPNYNRSYLEAARYTLEFKPKELNKVLGSDEAYLTKLLGESAQQSDTVISYHCDLESENLMTFDFHEDQVVAVSLTNWID